MNRLLWVAVFGFGALLSQSFSFKATNLRTQAYPKVSASKAPAYSSSKVDVIASPKPEAQLGKNFIHEKSIFENMAKDINKALRYLDKNKAREAFRHSGFDDNASYYQAVTFLEQDYPKNPARGFLKQRVVALRFLELSQYTQLDDCLHIMEKLTRHIAAHKGRPVQKALCLDLYELTQVCSRIERQKVLEVFARVDPQEARKAIMLGLKYEAQENI